MDAIIESVHERREREYREALRVWKESHPGETVNDVPQKETVTIYKGTKEEKEINLGIRISTIKQILKGHIFGKLTKEQIEFWVNQEGLSTKNKRKLPNEKDYMEALRVWKKEHPGKTVNDVPSKEKVTIYKRTKEEIEINLGDRISAIKQILKGYRKGELTGDQIEFWVNQEGLFTKNKRKLLSEKDYMEALRVWKVGHPGKTVNDVPQRETVSIYKGTKKEIEINLGKRISTIKQILKGHITGKLTEEQIEFWVNQEGLKVDKILKVDNVFYSKEKQIKVNSCLKKIRQKKSNSYKVNDLLEEFDIHLNGLNSYLNRVSGKNSSSREHSLMIKENETLKNYCIRNGYNYRVIERMIRLNKIYKYENIEDLIEKSIELYNQNGQAKPKNWIYEKYGVLVKHILLLIGLDAQNIIANMKRNTISLEEAMRHDVFRLNIGDKKYKWLEALYDDLLEVFDQNKNQKELEEILSERFYFLVKEYELEREEYQSLWNVLYKYIESMKKYLIADAGLTEDEEERIEKIVDYNLDEYDIEESYLVELNFSNGVLLGKKSDIYLRRQILRSYILDWNYYTEIEKKEIIRENGFTIEEVEYIERKRGEIDHTINRVRDMRRQSNYIKR